MEKKMKSCVLTAVFGVPAIICFAVYLGIFKCEVKAVESFVEEETELFPTENGDLQQNIENASQISEGSMGVVRENNQQESNSKRKNGDKQIENSEKNTKKKEETDKKGLVKEGLDKEGLVKEGLDEKQLEKALATDTISENKVVNEAEKTFHYPNQDNSFDDNGEQSSYLGKKKEGVNEVQEEYNKVQERNNEIQENSDEIMEISDDNMKNRQQTYWRVFLLIAVVLFAGGTWRMILQVENGDML